MTPEPILVLTTTDDQPTLGESRVGDPTVSEVERRLFGEMADPEVRRAIEVGAARARRAVAAGASEASIYSVGRIPEPEGEVIFQDAPATILKVCDPGDPMARLDLLQYQAAVPKALAAVQHDLNHGWHWLGEPPPPDPTPEDRIREAKAAGVRFPDIGDSLVVMVAAPKSYRGTVLYPLRARVVAIAETKLGLQNPAFNHEHAESVANQRFRPTKIWLDLELEEDQPETIDREWPLEQRHVDLAGYRPENVPGPLGPHERGAGWSFDALNPQVISRDHPRMRPSDAPCDRCGGQIRPHNDSVRFYAADHKHHLNFGDVRQYFAAVCRPCADKIGRFVFMSSPEPPVVLEVGPDEKPSSDPKLAEEPTATA